MADSLKITFPKAPLVYPALSRPDTKFDPLGTYKADVKLTAAEAKPIQAKLQARAKAHTGKALKATENSLWKNEVDDDGNETGNVIFSIRVKNKVGKKDGKTWDRRPMLIDAKKKPVDCNPWGGTIARVQAEIYEWEFGGKKGVSLQPIVVQIIDLVTGEGREADLGEFDEEDGYSDDGDVDTSDFDDEDADTDSSDDEAGDY